MTTQTSIYSREGKIEMEQRMITEIVLWISQGGVIVGETIDEYYEYMLREKQKDFKNYLQKRQKPEKKKRRRNRVAKRKTEVRETPCHSVFTEIEKAIDLLREEEMREKEARCRNDLPDKLIANRKLKFVSQGPIHIILETTQSSTQCSSGFTTLCNSLFEKTRCRYGDTCRFAHRIEDLTRQSCHFGYECRFTKSTERQGFYLNTPGPRVCQFWHPLERVESYRYRIGLE